MPKHIYNWRPDLPDQRDFHYSAPLQEIGPLPPSVDLRANCPPVYDQGNLGSCTSNALAGAHEFDQMKQKESAFMPSRLFIYYNERSLEGSVGSDSGAYLRDGIKTLSKQGVCSEDLWPYNIGQFTTKPSLSCYQAASSHKITLYQRIPRNLTQFKGCLASGYPFVLGITVYESFESDAVASTGIVPMPGQNEQVLGGHAIFCCGFQDSKQQFMCQNSWGSSWGDQGRFYLPYAYLLNSGLSSDFWTIRLVQ